MSISADLEACYVREIIVAPTLTDISLVQNKMSAIIAVHAKFNIVFLSQPCTSNYRRAELADCPSLNAYASSIHWSNVK
jgi:hypothetical protein